MSEEELRPVERRVLRGLHSGLSPEELGRRFGRSPGWVGRVSAWSDLPRTPGRAPTPSGLRPLERRVLHWRRTGADHAAIGARFHRGADFIAQVERLAEYKLDR
ncbi:MAG: hypothetical protein WKF43_04865 [Acidimicrobiales bacterium]